MGRTTEPPDTRHQKRIRKMDRIKIVAGTRKIGDQLCGKTITGFGKTWSQR